MQVFNEILGKILISDLSHQVSKALNVIKSLKMHELAMKFNKNSQTFQNINVSKKN